MRNNSYSNPPNFITRYGHVAGIDDADIRDNVNNGIGLLAYRGHGSAAATGTSWNIPIDYFNSADVNLLFNPPNRAPVVWSFACTNAKLGDNDSIAELWMEYTEGGAVSYYGATTASYTSQNHVLDEEMFLAVYDDGLITQSQAIMQAENEMANSIGSSNAWMYLLLGDPDMQIRTNNLIDIQVFAPEWLEICRLCDIKISVTDKYGSPLRNSLVGLYKEDVNGKQETATNAYADDKGNVTLQYSSNSTGTMFLAVEDGSGNSVLQQIPVR